LRGHADLPALLAGHRRLSQAFLLASAEFFQACTALGGKVGLGAGPADCIGSSRRVGDGLARAQGLVASALEFLLEAALLGSFLEFLPDGTQRGPADGDDNDEEIQPVAHVGKSIQSG